MAATLELESTLTDRYQTTVPDAVRRALRQDPLPVQPDGSVVLTRAAAAPDEDPVLDKFLSFLAHDIESNPGRVRGLDAGFAKRIRSLVKGVKVDLDAERAPEDE